MTAVKKNEILAGLKMEILRMQGFKPAEESATDAGLGLIRSAFPNHSFPLAAVHEVLAGNPEDAAAATGFVSAITAGLAGSSGACAWISKSNTLFPAGLAAFGVQPDRVISIQLQKEKDVLWALEESLKCEALSVVVGELGDLTFTESRRLQLAVEQSKVTGFLLRTKTGKIGTNACVSRWKISSIPSAATEELPGIGFPAWQVELLRIRNGKPGVWKMKWVNGRFSLMEESISFSLQTRKTG